MGAKIRKPQGARELVVDPGGRISVVPGGGLLVWQT